MYLTTYTKSRYRVVNPRKFIVSSTILTVLFVVALYYAIMGVRVTYGAVAEQFGGVKEVRTESVGAPPKPTVPTYQFSTINTQIVSHDKNDFINQLQTTLADDSMELSKLKQKYATDIKQAKQVSYNDLKLYNEYRYVLNYPSSDVTIDDVKMVEKICKQYGNIVNPHLWFSMIELESSYDSNATNSKSTARGWGQVLRGTGKWLYEDELKLGHYNHATMGTDKEINARMSIYYLGMLIKESGGVQPALIHYNGGELGTRYSTVILSKLKKNTNLTLKQLQVASVSQKKGDAL
jgi:hypothetical protein